MRFLQLGIKDEGLRLFAVGRVRECGQLPNSNLGEMVELFRAGRLARLPECCSCIDWGAPQLPKFFICRGL